MKKGFPAASDSERGLIAIININVMAKILIVTYSGYGNWFSLRLEAEGHNVDIYYCGKSNDSSKYILSGLIQQPLTAKPIFNNYDLVLFDLTGRPELAELSLSLGVPTLGDGDFNTEIENNRSLGIEIMEECGINVPPYEAFSDISEARKFIKKTNKRFVFKPCGGQEQETASTYVSKDAEDLLHYLDKLSIESKGAEFILQEVVEGTEVSTEGWFNGKEFFLLNSTLEEKKFMNGNIGPATGCSGNLVWCYDEMNPPLVFREGLGKMKDFLKQYNFRGPIDLNTIVTNTKLFGLEWTPRFGYDAFCTLAHLITTNLGEFLGSIASGERPVYTLKTQFAAGVRVSIPPYPSEIEGSHPEEIPIRGINLENEDEVTRQYYLYDACLDKDELITAGVTGFIAVVMGSGPSIEQVFSKVKDRIDRLDIPNKQYRTDIQEYVQKRYKTLALQGWLR